MDIGNKILQQLKQLHISSLNAIIEQSTNLSAEVLKSNMIKVQTIGENISLINHIIKESEQNNG